MYGNRHPSYEELALYAERPESLSDWTQMECHLAHCAECFAAVALHRALLDAARVTEETEFEATADLEPNFTPGLDRQSDPESALPLNNSTAGRNEETNSGLKDWILGLAGGLGLGGFGHMTASPALGKAAESHPGPFAEAHDTHDSHLETNEISSAVSHDVQHGWTDNSPLHGLNGANEFNSNDPEDGGGHGHHG